MRRAIARLGMGLALSGAAAVLAVVGAGLCLWAAYQYLEAATSPVAAALITGLAALIAAGVAVWAARKLTR